MLNGRLLYVGRHPLHGPNALPEARACRQVIDHTFESRFDGHTAMTRDHDIETVITSPEEFEAALAAIVEAAIEENVDVRGAWEFRTRGSTHNWEVEVTELAKAFDRDEEG